MTRAVLVGIGGRMGEEILRLAPEMQVQVVAGTGTGRRVPESAARLGIPVETDLGRALDRGADVVIDFSSPEGCAVAARICAERGVPLVSGTTGLDEAGFALLRETAQRVPVLHAPNMSVGIQLLLRLVEETARALGEGFDVEILEAHHRHKKDAPSGTALRLAETVAAALGRDLREDGRFGREGLVGPRPAREIGVLALRGGDVVGEHTVYFFGEGERLELTHRASSRSAFARGALRAARWIVGRPPGLYGMRDVLG
ncbi:MAG: 4-hydroxy-tetrahydrodipicolinate reductase [Pseudomonadota bacterium]|nr:MAG: 4-hydroxy-tetrahydrodipicolinate reductase [Pseudomonadota bacterium]